MHSVRLHQIEGKKVSCAFMYLHMFKIMKSFFPKLSLLMTKNEKEN